MIAVRRWPSKINCCIFKTITETILLILFGIPLFLVEICEKIFKYVEYVFDLRSIYFLLFTKRFNNLGSYELKLINKITFNGPWIKLKIRKILISEINKRNMRGHANLNS